VSVENRDNIAGLIDHALLRPELTDEALEAGCRLAVDWQVAGVCVLPHGVAACAQILAGSSVHPCAVIGFPFGANMPVVKAAEARRVLDDGATELDMVINIGKAISADWRWVRDDIHAVLNEAREQAARLKVIFETCYLNDAQKRMLCEICTDLAVDWVKTSTGFGPAGATEADIRLMRALCPPEIQVKASGGIRDLATVVRFRDLGCSRIGCSNTAAILDACEPGSATA
jgi:deoxyribose-phosphate aldolase